MHPHIAFFLWLNALIRQAYWSLGSLQVNLSLSFPFLFFFDSINALNRRPGW